MKITIESTTKIVQLDGVPCRVWEGQGANGIPVIAFIPRIATPDLQRARDFAVDLQDCRAPLPVGAAISSELVL